jgi:hypothetical protein
MHGFWAVFWLAVILKIPIVALLAIVWWAVRRPPVPEGEHEDGAGGSRYGPHPRTRPPQPPRRGPHGDPPPASPDRLRVTPPGRRVPARHER